MENRNERVGEQFEGSLEREWTGLGNGEEMMMYFFLVLLCTSEKEWKWCLLVYFRVGWMSMYFVQLRSVQSEGPSEALQSHLGASSYNISYAKTE